MDRPYRIAFFTKSKRKTLYTTYVIRALRRSGCEVRRVNMRAVCRYVGRSLADRIVRAHVDRFSPDACVIFSTDIQAETLDYFREKVKTAILLDDCFEVNTPHTEMLKRVDVFFHTSRGQFDEYRAAGVRRPVYVHSGVDPDYHRRARPSARYAGEVAFIGKAFGTERIEFIQQLSRDLSLKVYGAGWRPHGVTPARESVGVREFARICASSKIVVGIDKTAEQELYFSNRTWFVLGCGGFLLTRYIPGLETLFANHRHLVWYRDAAEAVDLARHYLKSDAERSTIARQGYEFVHEHYRFDRMAKNMIEVLFHDGMPAPLTDPGPSLDTLPPREVHDRI